MLSIFSCTYWPSVCLLWRNVYLDPFFDWVFFFLILSYFYRTLKVTTNPILRIETEGTTWQICQALWATSLGNTALLSSGKYLNLNFLWLPDTTCGTVTTGMRRTNPRLALMHEVQLISHPSTSSLPACCWNHITCSSCSMNKWPRAFWMAAFQSPQTKQNKHKTDPNQEIGGLFRARNPHWL